MRMNGRRRQTNEIARWKIYKELSPGKDQCLIAFPHLRLFEFQSSKRFAITGCNIDNGLGHADADQRAAVGITSIPCPFFRPGGDAAGAPVRILRAVGIDGHGFGFDCAMNIIHVLASVQFHEPAFGPQTLNDRSVFHQEIPAVIGSAQLVKAEQTAGRIHLTGGRVALFNKGGRPKARRQGRPAMGVGI